MAWKMKTKEVPHKLQSPIIPRNTSLGKMKHALLEAEKRLNADSVLSIKLKRPRGVKLSSEEIIGIMQRRGRLPAQHETVDHRRYARICDGGNPASEALVRANLAQFISETRQVIKNAIAEKKQGLILRMCLDDYDGIRLADFFTKSGAPLGKGRAFGEAIKQFFKDEYLVLKIVSVCLTEHAAAIKVAYPVVGNLSNKEQAALRKGSVEIKVPVVGSVKS